MDTQTCGKMTIIFSLKVLFLVCVNEDIVIVIYLFILFFWQIFAKMAPYTLGKAACVCRKWRYTIRNPVYWRNACLKAWQVDTIPSIYLFFDLHDLLSEIQFFLCSSMGWLKIIRFYS